ncbi:ABC transporter permease [Photobacterium damselae]|uniref:ABC transporter permease n=1 Tax=Photobacterium damselae TaxID=38293 RepID=UPI000D86AD4C|nr:ABC transporter permease [Photobacterium damselae]KAB1517083.1 ABC transporter permease [Photobacterium damselae subsp. damselae]NVO75579.1 ABC transporter permease [Photobacterium damselae subsp. damselae]TLS75134.1 ABC transporter permease [Photobacterium damselae subsp. damselae]TLS86124.1 ABC transporter permease [Photobacterium damselae subsp. damselae]UKA01785.1 ABC transporter permease [Photobacterium damselae subsp. damselae]
MSEQVITTPSRWQRFKQSDFLYFFRKDKVAMVSFAIFMAFATMAVFAPFIAPTNPYDLSSIDIMDAELPPSWMDEGDERFTLGTDDQGRDIFSTILYGSRLSLTIGLLAVGLQLILGVIIGLSAGYFGGRIDNFLMRIADVQLSFSTMMVAIIISAIFRTALGSELYAQYAVVMLVVIIGIAEWPQYARTIRASVLAEKKKEYVEAAKVMGFRSPRIMFRHILPNCLSPILVISTVQVANAIMSEAALSFLGLGLPVDQPSLGSLISIGFNYIFSGAWWITAFPGLVLVVLVLVINLLGDWLRDVFNPKIYKG